MSSSIAIPAPSTPASSSTSAYGQSSKAPASSSSSYSSSPRTSTPLSTQKTKMLHERRPSLLSTSRHGHFALPCSGEVSELVGSPFADFVAGSAIAKQECNVINIGEPDGPPRLVSRGRSPRLPHPASDDPADARGQISYVGSSQGFAWNPGELPSPSWSASGK